MQSWKENLVGKAVTVLVAAGPGQSGGTRLGRGRAAMEAFKVTVEAVVGGIIFWRAASYGAIFAAGAGVCGAGVGVCAAEGGAIPVPGERRPPSPSPHPAGRKRQEKMTKRAVVGGGRPSPELKGRVRRGTPARLSLRASVACAPPPSLSLSLPLLLVHHVSAHVSASRRGGGRGSGPCTPPSHCRPH